MSQNRNGLGRVAVQSEALSKITSKTVPDGNGGHDGGQNKGHERDGLAAIRAVLPERALGEAISRARYGQALVAEHDLFRLRRILYGD